MLNTSHHSQDTEEKLSLSQMQKRLVLQLRIWGTILVFLRISVFYKKKISSLI